MYRLALYGKGGIGKSTTACNLAAALAQAGHAVMQVGCDSKADSTRLLTGGRTLPTVLDRMRDGGAVGLDDIVFRAANGVLCVEAGGPVPGVGCAGRGIIAAFDLLEKLDAFGAYRPDFVLYDVLGDVVCGGFAMPLRGDYSDGVMVVTSGEMMSLYAAGSIMRAIENFQKRGYASFRGLIANLRAVDDEVGKIGRFCEEEGAFVAATVPRSPLVQRAEDEGAPAVELFSESELAEAYRALARTVESFAREAEAAHDAGTVREGVAASAGSTRVADEGGSSR